MNLLKYVLPILFAFLGGKNLYHRRNATNMFAIMTSAFSSQIVEGGGSEHEQKQKELLEKVKGTTEAQIVKLKGELQETIDAKMKDFAEGKISNEEFKKSMQGLTEKVDAFEGLKEKHSEILEILEKQGENLDRLLKKEQSVDVYNMTKAEKIANLIEGFVKTDEFKTYLKKDMNGSTSKRTIEDQEIQEKTIDITNDYTGGTVLISKPSGRVIDVPNRNVNIRDLMTVISTDQPNIVGQQVYDWSDEFTGSTSAIAENATAPEGSFKVKENSWSARRIAAFYDISKRMLKANGVRWLVNHLNAVLPKKLKYTEDWQLLFGDGQGDNLRGLTKDATIITLANVAYGAGDFASVATYDSGAQAIVTFTAAHGLRNGDSLTIANSTNYNATYTGVVVISKTQIIIDAAYVAEATAAWTGTGINPFYQQIDDAQEYDVLRVVASVMSYKDRMIDGFILNPIDAAKIDLLKGTDAHYVGISRDANGILRVMGLPVIETTAMPAGKFVAASFGPENMELAEYTELNLQFSDDVSYAKNNKVAAILEEEVIFPIYDPLQVAYGSFATLKTALETP